MKKILLIAAAALCLAACCQTAQRGPITTGDDCIAQTAYGQLLGYNDDGIYTFKGIRYAKAERFMPPQEPYTKESGATMFLDNKSELKHHFDDDFIGINQ